MYSRCNRTPKWKSISHLFFELSSSQDRQMDKEWVFPTWLRDGVQNIYIFCTSDNIYRLSAINTIETGSELSCTFTVATLLRALVSWVTMTLKGAFCVDAVTVSTQPNVCTLVNVCFKTIIKKKTDLLKRIPYIRG